MLQKLALPFAYVVPKGTPNKDIGTDPLPATGPYMITKYDPDSEMVFERNPEFKEWSAEAQPAGNPDKIVMKIGLPLEDATTQIQNGDADWMYDTPPADRLGELSHEVRSRRSTSTRGRRSTTWRSTPTWPRSTTRTSARRSTTRPTATP